MKPGLVVYSNSLLPRLSTLGDDRRQPAAFLSSTVSLNPSCTACRQAGSPSLFYPSALGPASFFLAFFSFLFLPTNSSHKQFILSQQIFEEELPPFSGAIYFPPDLPWRRLSSSIVAAAAAAAAAAIAASLGRDVVVLQLLVAAAHYHRFIP